MTAKLFSIKKPAYISTQKLGECEFIVFEKGKFSGEIDKQNLIPHGYGKLIYDNGDEFRGIFNLGKKTGRGEFFFKNGDSYIGDFENNLFDGHGRFEYANGGYFEGKFFRGKRHGKGKFCDSKGITKEGLWENNYFVA